MASSTCSIADVCSGTAAHLHLVPLQLANAEASNVLNTWTMQRVQPPNAVANMFFLGPADYTASALHAGGMAEQYASYLSYDFRNFIVNAPRIQKCFLIH